MSAQSDTRVPSTSRAFELVAKDATVTIGLLYGIGLLIANYYLLSLGFAEFEWLRPRYVFIGGTFVAPIVVVATIVYLAVSTRTSPFLGAHRAALALALGVMIPLLAVSVFNATRRQLLLSALLAAVVAGAFIVFQAPELHARNRAQTRSDLSDELSSHHLSPLFLLVLAIPLAFYFSIWTRFAFPEIPEQFGGAEPQYGYFFVREEHVEDAQLLGLQVTEADRESQGLRLVWEGNDYVIFQAAHGDGAEMAKVSNELFFAWVPNDTTDLVPMRIPPDPSTPAAHSVTSAARSAQ